MGRARRNDKDTRSAPSDFGHEPLVRVIRIEPCSRHNGTVARENILEHETHVAQLGVRDVAKVYELHDALHALVVRKARAFANFEHAHALEPHRRAVVVVNCAACRLQLKKNSNFFLPAPALRAVVCSKAPCTVLARAPGVLTVTSIPT